MEARSGRGINGCTKLDKQDLVDDSVQPLVENLETTTAKAINAHKRHFSYIKCRHAVGQPGAGGGTCLGSSGFTLVTTERWEVDASVDSVLPVDDGVFDIELITDIEEVVDDIEADA